MKNGNDASKLEKFRGNYTSLLEKLHQKGLLGELAIHPAIGVDGLIAEYAKVVGLNMWAYDCDSIIENISPILPQESIPLLKSKLQKNLVYISKIDICQTNILNKVLSPYSDISKKSFIIKGLFENAFMFEWDIDAERYYKVPLNYAKDGAKHWIAEMGNWLKTGDTIVAFDRHFFDFLIELSNFNELHLGIKDFGEDHDFTYKRQGVPIISLPHFAKVFQKG